MLKYCLIALCLCAAPTVCSAQEYMRMFSLDQLARVAEGSRYMSYCPSEEHWYFPHSMLGNCVGGPSGSPEQSGGGGN